MNPYAPPAAAVVDSKLPETEPKRPKLVWAIAAYYGCNVLAAAGGTYLVLSHPDVVPPILRTQFQASGWSQYAATTSVALLKLSAIVSLLFLRSIAVWLLWLVFVYRAIIFASHNFQKGALLLSSPLSQGTLIGNAAGLMLSLAIAVYATRLRSAGVLRTRARLA